VLLIARAFPLNFLPLKRQPFALGAMTLLMGTFSSRAGQRGRRGRR